MSGLILITVCLANVLAIRAHCCNCDCKSNTDNVLLNQYGHHQYYAPPIAHVAAAVPVVATTGAAGYHHQYSAPQLQILEAPASITHKEHAASSLLHLNREHHQQVLEDHQNQVTYTHLHHQPATHYINIENGHHQHQQQQQGQNHEEHHHQHHGDEHDHHHKKDAHYKFEYAVNDHKTHDIKRHKEERNGDVVKGEYSLLEHDGNVRTVKYYADWKTGFHAEVLNSKKKSLG